MSVSLVKTPIAAPLHNPTDGACIVFGMNMPIADLTIIAPAQSQLVIEVPPSPASAGSFNFHGHTFTANAGPADFTASTFKVEAGDQLKTAQNIANMLKSNLDIYPNYTIFANWDTNIINPPAYMTAVAEYGYVEPGTFANSLGWAVTFTPGEQGFFRETKKIAYQLFAVPAVDPSAPLNPLPDIPLMPLQAVKPRVNLNNLTTYDLDVDFAKVIKSLPYTTLPFLNANVPKWDPNIMKKVYLLYGSVDNVSCTLTETNFKFSDYYWIINQAIDLRNQGGPKDFSYLNSPQHLAKPLNYGPIAGVGYCRNSYNWLWFNFNFRLLAPPYNTWFGHAYIRQYNSANIVIQQNYYLFDPTEVGSYDGIGVGILPIGGANFPGGLNPLTCYVKVSWVFTEATEDWNEEELLSEVVTIRYKDCDCEPYEFYFLCEYGGYDTIRFEKFEEVTTKVSQQTLTYEHYCRDWDPVDPVADYYTYLSKAGSNQGNTIANRKFRVTSGKMAKTEKVNRFVEMFLKSESRFFRLTQSGASRVGAVKINIVSTDTIVYKESGKVVYSFEFQFAEDLATISER